MEQQKETSDADFIRILAADVQHALNLAKNSNRQADRRNLIRTIISATEGISWDCRNHVRSIMKEVDQIPPLLDLAFSELTYSVNERGILVEQPRFITMTAMIRLTVNVAKIFSPDLQVDFGNGGWEALKKAIEIRNRIIHPKSVQDLDISEEDIETAQSGFFWFITVAGDVMEATTQTLRLRATLFRQILEKLKAGDPETIALYHSTYADIHD